MNVRALAAAAVTVVTASLLAGCTEDPPGSLREVEKILLDEGLVIDVRLQPQPGALYVGVTLPDTAPGEAASALARVDETIDDAVDGGLVLFLGDTNEARGTRDGVWFSAALDADATRDAVAVLDRSDEPYALSTSEPGNPRSRTRATGG